MTLPDIKETAEAIRDAEPGDTDNQERIAECIHALAEHIQECNRVINNHAKAINSRQPTSLFGAIFGER